MPSPITIWIATIDWIVDESRSNQEAELAFPKQLSKLQKSKDKKWKRKEKGIFQIGC